MEITLHPRTVALTLLWVVITLSVVNSGVLFLYFYLEDDEVFGLVELFDFDIEGNIPTFFSASVLLFCSALLGLAARSAREKRDGTRPYWIGLAVILCIQCAAMFLRFRGGRWREIQVVETGAADRPVG